MNLEKSLPRPLRRSRWCQALVAAIVLVIIIVIVVPVAVIMHLRNQKKTFVASVIIPLYIYPSNDSSWSPLYNAVRTYCDLNFVVVVNPSSGPGNGTLPSDSYTTAINSLNAYSNVQTVGYVRTGYASRNITQVISEVQTYAGWYTNSNSSSNISMHGIFFDEAPHQYTAAAVDYMITIDSAVKNATGLQGAKTIIHNPGTIPDSQFNTTRPDITVVFEDSYSAWQQKEVAVRALSGARSSYSLMLNSVPTMANSTLSSFVASLSKVAEYLYVTSKDQDFYESFASDWMQFVGQLPKPKNSRRDLCLQ